MGERRRERQRDCNCTGTTRSLVACVLAVAAELRLLRIISQYLCGHASLLLRSHFAAHFLRRRRDGLLNPKGFSSSLFGQYVMMKKRRETSGRQSSHRVPPLPKRSLQSNNEAKSNSRCWVLLTTVISRIACEIPGGEGRKIFSA